VLFVNGETGPAEVYALDPATGGTLATLNAAFGSNHVVGGACHRTQRSLFLLQDQLPGDTDDNRVAEVHGVFTSVLPISRSVQINQPTPGFATIINTAPPTGINCRIEPRTPIPATFTYQTTDLATNQLTGTVNTPVAISSGASQSFAFAFTPNAAFDPVDTRLKFGCDNLPNADIQSGLNSLLISASVDPVPDIVALAATISNDGVARNATAAVFTVATSTSVAPATSRLPAIAATVCCRSRLPCAAPIPPPACVSSHLPPPRLASSPRWRRTRPRRSAFFSTLRATFHSTPQTHECSYVSSIATVWCGAQPR
jgi:hypothetical protein